MLEEILQIAPQIISRGFSPKVCEDILQTINLCGTLEEFNDELSKWLLTSKTPKQLSVYNTFGQPPVTLYNNGEFVVDLYFWMHADTSLHSHSFQGAFKVLFGKSLHEEFSIEETKDFSRDVKLNELKRTSSEILHPGCTRQILSGNSFNHRVVHLSSPTVTLCIRTVNDINIPQWHHFDNGLSILKREIDESVFKKMFYGDYLQKMNHSAVQSYTMRFIESLDLSETMNLFEQLTIDTMGMADDFQSTLYEVMISKLNQTKWFKLYEEACDMQVVVAEEDTEVSKLIAHMNTYSYDEKEACSLFTQLEC